MKTNKLFLATCTALLLVSVSLSAQEVSVKAAAPVVVKTIPESGATDVDAGLKEIRVTFSKPMQDGSWSWTTYGGDQYFPTFDGKPSYLGDKRTCVVKVKLEPGKTYAVLLNSAKFKNFRDLEGHSSMPYLLIFQTKP